MSRNTKRLSAEEALTLLLEASDNSESEVENSDTEIDVVSLDPPAPTAVKVKEPEYCIYLSSNSDSDYQELKPATEQASPPSSPRHVQIVQNATERYGQKPSDRNVKKSSSKKNASSVRTRLLPNVPADNIPDPFSSQFSTVTEDERPPEYVPTQHTYMRELSSSPEPPSSSPDTLSRSSSPLPSSGSSSDEQRFLPPENFPGPPKFTDTQRDIDEMNDSIEDFDLGETISKTVNRPNFLISKVPFRIMCMYIKRYLISIQVDPMRPQYPVPGMDKNQKRHFRRKVERYEVKRGLLYYLHKFVDKTIGYERGNVDSFAPICFF